ncbi:hypothetical protein JCM8208_000071 [Rhodotorula glutinis]
MPATTIDVSDFDPFSPTASTSSSRSSSPHPLGALFPAPRPPSSSRASPGSATPALAAAAPPPVHTQGVAPGADPLGGLLGTLALDPSSSSARHSPAPTAASSTASYAQEQRNTRILRDLDRGPFAPSTPPTPLAPPPLSQPHSTPLSPSYTDEPTSLPASPAVPIPSPSSPTRTTHRQQHPSPSSTVHRRPSASFSPPRRLSTLMDTSSFPHGPSSPPAESSILSDPFHAASSAAGAAWRRIRDASAGAGDLIEQAMEGEWTVAQGDTSGEWGEFQGGTPELPVGGAGSASGSGSGSARASAAPSPRAQPVAVPSPHAHAPTSAPQGGMGTLGRAASLPVSAAAAAGSSLSSGFSSLFGSAHPSEGAAPAAAARKPSPPSPARAATTSGAGGARAGGFDPTAQPIKLVGLRPGVQRVLEDDVAEGIRPSLPPRLRLSSRWTLLYSLDQHGISLTTLFSSLQRGLASRDGGFVLVVKTSKGDVCGAYVSEALRDGAREQRGSTRWLGDGSCFLWRATPFPPHDFRLGSSVQSFKPTFRNTYYAYATSTPSPVLASPLGGTGGEAFLAFGGGEDGQFGLWVDGVFERGWTGRSETFGNEPLVGGAGGGARGEKREGEKAGGSDEDVDEDEGEGRKFEIVGLECWAVGS